MTRHGETQRHIAKWKNPLWNGYLLLLSHSEGLAVCCHQQARGRGWWERKEVFIQMLHDLGECQTRFKAHPSPSGNPPALSQTKTKGSIQSSLSHIKCCPLELQVAAEWSSAFLPATVRPPLNMHVWPVLSSAVHLPGSEVPQMHQWVCSWDG